MQKGGPAGGYNYTYDLVRNLTQISGTKYTYDALNRLSAMTARIGDPTFTLAPYGYDNVGNLATVTYANGVTPQLQLRQSRPVEQFGRGQPPGYPPPFFCNCRF